MSFGATSGVITPLGLLIGLISSTSSKLAVIGGILTIAITDSLADALGMHISEESLGESKKQIWNSSKYVFLAKFFLALSFIIPVLIFNSLLVVGITSSIWGISLIIWFSFNIAKKNNESSILVIGEHLLLVILVIGLTYGVGLLVNRFF